MLKALLLIVLFSPVQAYVMAHILFSGVPVNPFLSDWTNGLIWFKVFLCYGAIAFLAWCFYLVLAILDALVRFYGKGSF